MRNLSCSCVVERANNEKGPVEADALRRLAGPLEREPKAEAGSTGVPLVRVGSIVMGRPDSTAKEEAPRQATRGASGAWMSSFGVANPVMNMNDPDEKALLMNENKTASSTVPWI